MGGPKTARRTINEDRKIEVVVPEGSRFKGYEDFVVQDLILRPHVTRYRRERWLTPEGRTVLAPLPVGVSGGHFGPALRRFILAQYHECHVTMPRLLAQVHSIGIDISKRRLVRLLTTKQDGLVEEARDVLRAGLTTAPCMASLGGHETRRFADEAAWKAHLASLGITDLKVTPDPVTIATEGALWGAVKDHRFLNGTVVLSDDAGQFNVGHHALCWIHAERLVHKLEPFTEKAARPRTRSAR